MRKQSGFTLIELMVVMAIIAILATAGLSAYGGYLKKARDSTRISDLKAIEAVVLSALGVSGASPRLDVLVPSLTEMNNGTLLRDPMVNKNICLDDIFASGITCQYEYYPCDSYMGYILKTRFESRSSAQSMYDAYGFYTIGKCVTEISGAGIGGIIQ